MLTRDRILIFSPIALAVLTGVCAVVATGVANADFVDSVDYLAAARMIVEHGQYPDVGSLPFFRAPLYPGLIALIWSIVPGSILAIKIVQVALFAASAWITGKTVKLVTKNAWMAFAAAMIFAANPFFAFEAAAIQTECLQIFLLSLAFYMIVRLLQSNELKLVRALPLGIVLGLASLNKPSVLGACVVLASVIWFFKRKVANSIYVPAAVVAIAFLTILPWSMFVYQTKGEFFLVNDAGGYNLWSGNLPASVEYYQTTFATSGDAAVWGEDLAKIQMTKWEGAGGYSNLSLKQRESLWTAKAVENMTAQPGAIVKLWGYKFLSFWKPLVSSSIYSTRAVALSAAVMIPLFVLGFLGLVRTIKDPETSSVGWMFVVLALFATAVHVALVSNLRLRLPYIDPWLTMFAGIGVCDLVYRFFRSPATVAGVNRFEPAAIAAI